MSRQRLLKSIFGLTILIIAMSAKNVFADNKACDEKLANTDSALIEQQALKVFKDLGLNGGESDDPQSKFSVRWRLSQVIEKPDGLKLLVMRQHYLNDGADMGESQEFDVLILKDGVVRAFEDLYPPPSHLVVQISALDYETRYPEQMRNIFYVIELTDKASIIAALKSLNTGIRYFGFSGVVVKGNANFDPTPGRTWHVEDAKFDLRRGSTPEVADIQAFQFDDNFDEYFSGAQKITSSTGVEGAVVAPWGQSAVVGLLTSTHPD